MLRPEDLLEVRKIAVAAALLTKGDFDKHLVELQKTSDEIDEKLLAHRTAAEHLQGAEKARAQAEKLLEEAAEAQRLAKADVASAQQLQKATLLDQKAAQERLAQVADTERQLDSKAVELHQQHQAQTAAVAAEQTRLREWAAKLAQEASQLETMRRDLEARLAQMRQLAGA